MDPQCRLKETETELLSSVRNKEIKLVILVPFGTKSDYLGHFNFCKLYCNWSHGYCNIIVIV